MEIFWWIKPKFKSTIWAQSINMLDVRLVSLIQKFKNVVQWGIFLKQAWKSSSAVSDIRFRGIPDNIVFLCSLKSLLCKKRLFVSPVCLFVFHRHPWGWECSLHAPPVKEARYHPTAQTHQGLTWGCHRWLIVTPLYWSSCLIIHVPLLLNFAGACRDMPLASSGKFV